MSDLSKLTEYIENTFDLYGLDKLGFFFDYDENSDKIIDIPLFANNQINEDIINRICVPLGLSKQEVMSMDTSAAKKYWDKYPFFHLYREFKLYWEWYSRYKDEKPSQSELLLKAIFSDEENIYRSCNERYDYQDVKRRMIDELKKMDTVMPGTYHDGAAITNLAIHTETFFSFPQCGEMILAFIKMIERLKELFFASIKEDLSEDDVREMNFLASYLNATDAVMPSVKMTYDNVQLYRGVYIEENLTDFFSYVKIRCFINVEPWRCREFFDDMDLAQKFVNIFPQSKAMMREFAMNVTKFYCVFIWSDAKPIVFSPEEERKLADLRKALGQKETPWEERAKERTVIYVDKTTEELSDGEQYAQRLRAAASPETKGGLHLPIRQLETDASVKSIARIQKRVAARNGGNQ